MSDPVDPKVEPKMRAIIETLREFIPKEFGITLLIFDYGNAGRFNYMSTAVRDDMVASLKEVIAKFEGRYVEHKGDLT